MPFSSSAARPFNQDEVEASPPNQTGVYGLYSQGQWIYIGSGDIRERLLSHLRGENEADACILAREPTHWVDEVTSNYRGREGVLIREFKPPCNERGA